MKTKHSIPFLFAIVALFWGCYPEGPQYAEELDIVFTIHDQEFPFQSKSTYSMPDSIVKITGDLIGDDEFIRDIYAQPMLGEIERNMEQRGWTRVSQNADIELLPAAWSSTTVTVSGYYGSYWCWYNPYYCGGGWYYPYPVTSSYTTGTLVMFMTDPNSQSTDDSRRIVWSAAVNGLLTGDYDASRVNVAIDQVFEQSPYLTTN
ncbi:MAG: DUF4136 domain-containing protein [Cryomorphaceae bacterium]